ncbi:MAG: CinA family protein [Anaerolineae bacterium]|nr:CinA family protein [Anaerolineae bacterium]
MTDELLEVRAGKLLTAHGLTLSTAESCTGGLLINRLTDISGSSAYIMVGVVTYSNDAKMSLLNVRLQTIIDYGAVSEQTAAEMATGARKQFNTNVGLSVTGIAGPTGGTPTKPIGLTYIGLSADTLPSERIIRRVWNGDRAQNKQYSADAALRLLIEYLEEL